MKKSKKKWSDHLKKYLKNKIPLCALVCALLLVMLMPATAFAAIAKRLTDVDAQLETVKELGILQKKDDEDMYKNYILTSFISDPGLVTEIIGNSNIDPMSLMVNAIADGSKEPAAAIQQYEGYITSTINSIYRQ